MVEQAWRAMNGWELPLWRSAFVALAAIHARGIEFARRHRDLAGV